MVAHVHQDANVLEYPNLNANCLSRGTVSPTSDTGILETIAMIHWRDQRVCVFVFLVANAMVQHSLNVKSCGQNLPRSDQWTSL